MKKMLIAIDLDGTLLRNDGTISEENRKAITKAMENGHMIVLATGRGYRNSRYVLAQFPVFPYYINANGTTITQGDPEKVLFTKNIPFEIGTSIYKIAREYPTFIELYHGLDAYDSYKGCDNLKTCGKMESYRKQLWETNVHMKEEALDQFVLEERHSLSKFHIVCITLEEKQELRDEYIKLYEYELPICREAIQKRNEFLNNLNVYTFTEEELTSVISLLKEEIIANINREDEKVLVLTKSRFHK